MKNAFVVGWRNTVETPRRALLTGLSSALGVALLTAAVLGGITARQTVVGGVSSLVSLGDVGVVPGPGHDLLRHETVPRLAALAGVDRVLPTLSRETVLSGGDLRDEPALLTGVPVEADSLAALVVTDGRLPAPGAHEILVSSGPQVEGGLVPGVRLDVATPRGPVDFTVVGVVDHRSLGVFAEGHVFTSLEAVRSTFEADGALTRIDLSLDPAAADGWAVRHQQDLPDGAIFQDTAAIARGIEPITAAVSAVTGLLGLLALTLAASLVSAASLGAVRSRRSSYAALRALGADKRWIGTSVLAEAAIVCGAGTVIGSAVGVIAATMSAHDPPGLTSTVSAVVIGIGGGVVAGGIGSLRAVREVVRISPALQLRGSVDDGLRAIRPVRPVGIVVGLAAAAIVSFASVSGETVTTITGIAGCAFLSVLVARALVGPSSIVAASALRSGSLASRDDRSVRRHVATPAALVVFGGVLLSSTVGAVADATVTQIERQFGADVQVTSAVPLVTAPAFERVDGVAAAAASATGTVGIRSGADVVDVPVQAVDSDLWFDIAQLPWLDVSEERGETAVRSGAGVAVPRGVADLLGVEVGDAVVVSDGGVDRDVTVAGTFTSLATGQQIVVDQSLGRDLGLRGSSRWDISAGPGVAPDVLAERVTDLVRGQPGVQVITGHETRLRATTEVVGLTAGLFAVAAVTVGLGALGASSALSLNVESRRGDIAILRAVGAHRGLIARIIATDLAVVALVGVIGGVAGGLVGGLLGTDLVSGVLGVDLPPSTPWNLIGGVVALTVAALAAAAVPAVRSGLRTDPLTVMRAEST
jgi:putative ABC transport system permease protein